MNLSCNMLTHISLYQKHANIYDLAYIFVTTLHYKNKIISKLFKSMKNEVEKMILSLYKCESAPLI